MKIVHMNSPSGPCVIEPYILFLQKKNLPFEINIVKNCLKDILSPVNPFNLLINIELIRYYTSDNGSIKRIECSIREKYISHELISIPISCYRQHERDYKIDIINT